MATCQFAFMPMDIRDTVLPSAGVTAESETVSGTNAATTAAATAAQGVCRVATDTACYVSFGTAPNAGTDAIRFLMPAGGDRTFHVKAGDKAACIALS